MKVDITSMFFNSKIEGKTATPAWRTSIGQNKSKECRIETEVLGVTDMIVGMTYKMRTDLQNLNMTDVSGDLMLCAVFDKIFVNGTRINGVSYTLLLLRETSESHEGRLQICYAPKITFNGHSNSTTIDKMRETLGCSVNGCWFVYEIAIKNQDELHFYAVVVDKNQPALYAGTSQDRSRLWRSLLPTNGKINYSPYYGIPLQIIYYGAPGTGKSYEINRLTIGKDVVRTTFHPDSDYSTFVGAYKPTMEEMTKCVVPVVVNNGISLSPASQYKEKQITYKFVKQAFLKAYLAAWKKMCNPAIISPVTFKVGSSSYTIKSIDNNGITQIKEERISKNAIARIWNDASYWGTGVFLPTTGEQSGTSVQQAISKYINEKLHTAKEQFEEGWNKLIEELKLHEIKASKATKSYLFKDSGKDDEIIFTAEASNSKERLKNCYEHPEEANGVEKGITDILKRYNPSDFDDAWGQLKDAVNTPKPAPQFLVIEEINRGNCAQIFGDLFQLLDRSDNGFSSYPIEADSDLQQAIAEAFANEKEYQLSQDIYVEGAVPGYQSNYEKTLSEDIQAGRILLLPPNLYIWATMNTSDQSLFPIDSAFKRRWDWKYTKIANMDSKVDHPYKIIAKGKEYSWWQFIDKMNNHIYSMVTSEDKKLGYFFVHKDNGKITAEMFVNKVLFYLYNDALKDYTVGLKVKEDGKEKAALFSDFYNENGEVIEDKVLEALDMFLAEPKKENIDSEKQDQ